MTALQTVDGTEPLARPLAEPVVRLGSEQLRDLLSGFAHALMSAEVDLRCGAGYGQRSTQRVNSRRGYRHRTLPTPVGPVQLSVPRLRSGTYQPDWLLARPERAASVLADAVEVGYRHGFTAVALRELVATLDAPDIPESRIGDLTLALEARLAAVRNHLPVPLPLTHPPTVELADEPRHLTTAAFLGEPQTHGPTPEAPVTTPTQPKPPAAKTAQTATPAAESTPSETPIAKTAQPETSATKTTRPDERRRKTALPSTAAGAVGEAEGAGGGGAGRGGREHPVLIGTAAVILAALVCAGLCAALGGRSAAMPADLRAMMPALISVIEMPRDVTRADLLKATCGALHDDFGYRSDMNVAELVQGMQRDFGTRSIARVADVRRGPSHLARAQVTATATRIPAPQPVRTVDVEFDTSTTPWRICAVTPGHG